MAGTDASWPADHPKHAIIENLLAMPKGTIWSHAGALGSIPRINPRSPTYLPVFHGEMDGKTENHLGTSTSFGGERGGETTKEETPSPVFESWWMPLEKFPSRTASICPRADATGWATVHLEGHPASGEPQYWLVAYQKDRNLDRICAIYLEAFDIHLISVPDI